MSHRPTKMHWDTLLRRKDVYYSLRAAWNKFLIDKAKLISKERKNNDQEKER